MKRFFTLLIVFAAVAVNAQSLQLKHNGQVIGNNDTISILVTPAKVTDNLYIEYANVSSSDLMFKVKKEELSMVSGAQTTFCIGGTCYAGTQSQDNFIYEGDSVTIENEELVFHATYTTEQQGTSIVKYSFFNSDNAEDAVSFFVVYNYTVGVNTVAAANVMRAYPNPATSSVNIEYAAPYSNTFLVIKNLTGSVVYKAKVEGTGVLYVNLTNLNAGVYIYGLECGGRMQQTKKLVVK